MAKTANQLIVREQPGRVSRPVAAATHLYEGCLSFIDSNGRAVATTNSGANKLGGLNAAEADNSTGAAGAINVELIRDVVQLEGSGFTAADVDKPAYVSDNFTVTLTAAGNVYAGPIVKVISSTKVMVDLSKGAQDQGDLDVTLQSITLAGATGVPQVNLTDNLADALSFCQSTNDYLTFTTTNSSESVNVGQNLAIADGKNIVLDTTTGTKIGTATGQKLGFFNATPVAQRSAYTQTYSTADKTHAAPTAATLTAADGAGTNDNTIGAITADASVIAAVQEIVDEINKLVADVADTKQIVNSIVDDLQALGLVG